MDQISDLKSRIASLQQELAEAEKRKFERLAAKLQDVGAIELDDDVIVGAVALAVQAKKAGDGATLARCKAAGEPFLRDRGSRRGKGGGRKAKAASGPAGQTVAAGGR